MNSNVSLLLGFVIGVASGAGGMLLAGKKPVPSPAPAISTNLAVREFAETSREKRLRSPMWWDMDAPTPEVRPASGGPPLVVLVTNFVNGVAEVRTNRNSRWDEWRNLPDADRQQRFAILWSNQMIAARAEFVSNAVLNEAEATRFDVLASAMNIRLKQLLDPVVQQYQNGWRPAPEDRTRLMAQISAVLVTTYDEMDRNMPKDWRDSVPSNSTFSLTQFVEPQYTPFMRGLGARPQGGPGGFGPPPMPTSSGTAIAR